MESYIDQQDFQQSMPWAICNRNQLIPATMHLQELDWCPNLFQIWCCDKHMEFVSCYQHHQSVKFLLHRPRCLELHWQLLGILIHKGDLRQERVFLEEFHSVNLRVLAENCHQFERLVEHFRYLLYQLDQGEYRLEQGHLK